MSIIPCPACRYENPAKNYFCGKCGRSLRRTKAKVLVVDDEPRITDLVRNILEVEGMKVCTASSVKEAMPLTAAEKPSVIITDMMMPETGGLEFIRRLKENPATRFIKIVVLTVLDAFEDVRKTVLEGADDYICKPFDPQELLWSVERLLGKQRLETKEKAPG